MTGEAQQLPIRMYQTADRLMVAVPMPGLEADDIAITVCEDRIVLHGEERGPGQHELDLLVAEWCIGPYHREIELPVPVDGPRANASYGNGVLVVSLPKAEAGRGATAHFELVPTASARGERVGHRGRVAS
jgi:HSP20 family protein